MAVKVQTTEGERLLPLPSEIAHWTMTTLEQYMPKAGGIFTGEIQIPEKTELDLSLAKAYLPATEAQLNTLYLAVFNIADSKFALVNHIHQNASLSQSGFMSTSDKAKLDSIILTDIEEVKV